MYHIFCIHSSIEGHLGSFQLLDIINEAAINIVEYVSLLQVETSFGYMPRKGIDGSSGSTMSNFLRNHQTDFQSVCTSLQFHQQWESVPLSPSLHQHLLSPEFLILVILADVRWNLRVFWFAFPWWLRMLNIFSGASLPFGIPQVRFFVQFWAPFFNGVIWFSEVHLLEFFIYVGY